VLRGGCSGLRNSSADDAEQGGWLRVEMQHRMTSALSSVKGGKEKAPRIAAEVKKERRKMSSPEAQLG
jgi:hypothetical protein